MELSLKGRKLDSDVVFATWNEMVRPLPCLRSDDAKDKLYKELHTSLASMPKEGKLVFLAEFNARVRTDNAAWMGVLEPTFSAVVPITAASFCATPQNTISC
ncbi:unnamed protein product [Schistocephalus solidus]|uniref:Uncharacterized protein n=1 Tax=Schistocephalus solidus TaxID=70667 RepID=A0A183TA78_SCHSO|nr:unnamed protein product [Schistocephalus solidus]